MSLSVTRLDHYGVVAGIIIAQRRARAILKENNDVVPNQINKPIQNPTARWLFQFLDWINIVKVKINNTVETIVDGMCDIKEKIVTLFWGYCIRDLLGLQKISWFRYMTNVG